MDAGDGPHPVVVFSHGLGGSRGTYSVLCAELASQVPHCIALRSDRPASKQGLEPFGHVVHGKH